MVGSHYGGVIVAGILGISIGVAGCCCTKSTMLGSTTKPDLTPGTLLAGAAAVEIPLTGGAPLAGYSATQRRVISAATVVLTAAALAGHCIDPTPGNAAVFFHPALGKLDPIRARALILANGGHKLAFVKLDTVGTSRKLRDDIFAHASTLGIAYEDLVVVATHTHSGPGAVANKPLWEVAGTDCFSDLIYQQVLQGAKDALTQAHATLQPAALGIGTTSESLASENRSGRPGIYDSELGVLKVTTTSGTPIAALFNFAVHGTALGPANLFFSADCMGAMEKVVETGLPGAVAIFTNGAEGDVAPAHKDAAGMVVEGTLVGGDVVTLWPTIPTKSAVALGGSIHDVVMPSPRYNTGAGCLPLPETTETLCDVFPSLPLAISLSPAWLSTTLPFQALRIDDSVFAAVPGEPITEIGWQIKASAQARGFAHGFVLGLANDYGGYFTTLAEYQRGKYEGASRLYGPTTGQVVVTSMDDVLSEVQ